MLAVLLLFGGGCASNDNRLPGADERGLLSVRMVNLSAAVDAYFMDLPTAPKESDAVVLRQATSHDPRLLAPEFSAYVLKVQYQNPYAVVLLCSADGKAIMEDAGCSARLDRQAPADADCRFTLRVLPGCEVQGADPQ
jgi:hypothetical protein